MKVNHHPIPNSYSIEDVKFHVDFSLRLIFNGITDPDCRFHSYVDPANFAQMSNIAKQVVDDYFASSAYPPVSDFDKVVKFAYTVAYKLVEPNYTYGSIYMYTPNEWPRGYMDGDELRGMLQFASQEGEYEYELYETPTENKIRRYVREKRSVSEVCGGRDD